MAVLHWNEALGRWDGEEVAAVDEQSRTVSVAVELLSFAKTEGYLDPYPS